MASIANPDRRSGYIINDNGKNLSLASFKVNNNMYFLNNKEIINHIGFKNPFDEIYKSFDGNLSCNCNHELSILKGSHYITLTTNKHNCEYYSQLHGETVFYLFNPKHKMDIKDKQINEIKKWAFKISLKPGIILYIPPNWDYFFETETESIINRTYSDNYLTYIYNNILR